MRAEVPYPARNPISSPSLPPSCPIPSVCLNQQVFACRPTGFSLSSVGSSCDTENSLLPPPPPSPFHTLPSPPHTPFPLPARLVFAYQTARSFPAKGGVSSESAARTTTATQQKHRHPPPPLSTLLLSPCLREVPTLSATAFTDARRQSNTQKQQPTQCSARAGLS